jgi:hypothetical protein
MASQAKLDQAAANGFSLEAVRRFADPPEDVDWEADIVLVSSPPPPEAAPPAVLMDPGNEDELIPVSYAVSRKAAAQSTLLRDLVASEAPDAEITVPVQGTATALAFVVAFLEHHVDAGPLPAISRPLRPNALSDLAEFDRRFVKALIPSDAEHLVCVDVLCVANYLGVGQLVDLTSAGIGMILLGKSIPEIREVFRIPNDLTDEQVAEIEKQNQQYLSAYPDS